MEYLYDENCMLYGFFYNGAKYFYIRDTMQNILGIIDADGTAVVQYNYSAYGECISVTGDMAGTVGEVNSFRYKGYYFDRETGFFYCKSRYYLPEWQRWLNSDDPSYLALNSVKRVNLFVYCGNNPITHIDYSGTFWKIIVVVIVAVILPLLTLTSSEQQVPTEEQNAQAKEAANNAEIYLEGDTVKIKFNQENNKFDPIASDAFIDELYNSMLAFAAEKGIDESNLMTKKHLRMEYNMHKIGYGIPIAPISNACEEIEFDKNDTILSMIGRGLRYIFSIN